MITLNKKYVELLERYTQTDIRYLVRGGFWLTLGQIFGMAAGFLTIVVFSNVLSQEVYGTYRFVLAFASILTILTLPGINGAVAQAVARGVEGEIGTGLRTRLAGGVLASAASLLVALYYYLNMNMVLAGSFLIVAAGLPAMNTFLLYQAILVGKKHFRELALADVGTRVALFVVLVGAVVATKNLWVVLGAYFGTYSIVRLYYYLKTVRRNVLNEKRENGLVRYGLHLSVMNAVSVVAGQIDKILIFHFLGAAPLAVYVLALTPYEQLKGVLGNIKTLAFPKFSNQPMSNIKKTFFKRVAKFELGLVVVVGLYILVAPPIFNIFFPQYLESIIYSQIFMVLLLVFPRSLITTILSAHKKVKELYMLRLTGPILRLIVVVPAIVLWGLWGAVLGTIVVEAFLYFLYILVFKHVSS